MTEIQGAVPNPDETPTDGDQNGDFQVLTVSAVRWAIDQLGGRRIHPFFLAYLHLRERALAQGSPANIQPDWSVIGEYLTVPNGPPTKPYYRPWFNQHRGDGSRFWMNPNLAGSYAPSSVRPTTLRVVDISGGSFALRENHAELALEYMLYKDPLAILPLATYLYRDFGITSPTPAKPMDLIYIFRKDFRFNEGAVSDNDFGTLFGPGTGEPKLDWFEPLVPKPGADKGVDS